MTLEELKKLKVDKKLIEDINLYQSNNPVYLPPSERLRLRCIFVNQFLVRLKLKPLDNVVDFVEDFVDYVYMTYIHEDRPTGIIVIDKSKHAKGRTTKEKEKRSGEHFIKEIYPTLTRGDKVHFKNKYKGKGFKGL